MQQSAFELKTHILQTLEKQGYVINDSSFALSDQDRETKRNIHFHAKAERVTKSLKFILNNKALIQEHLINGKDLEIEKIDPQIIQVEPDSKYEKIFRWWNLVWWSLPHEKAYGRQIRYVVWDKYHNAPIGLIGLQSPILSWSVRDDYLGITQEQRDYWVNQSLSAQRLGSLPPYNDILGGKLVASLMTTEKVRKDFFKKYKNQRTLLQDRILPANLLFIATTGAYGKSSVYNRLKFDNEYVAKFIGYSRGSGTFHIPNTLFEELVLYLESENYPVKRGYGNGPSRKLRLIDVALTKLGIKDGNNHGVQRAVYLFPFVSNLHDVIQKNKRPKWFKRDIADVTEYWKNRWAIPRAGKNQTYRNFDKEVYMQNTLMEIENMVSYISSNIEQK